MSEKPWEKRMEGEDGEYPGGLCCQRSVGGRCYEHNPENYVRKTQSRVRRKTMPLKQVIPHGRPPAQAKTVRFMPSGVMRMSPDLCIGVHFKCHVDLEKKQIVMTKSKAGEKTVFRMWYANKHARSGIVSMLSALKMLGLEKKETAGRYAAEVKGNEVVIDMRSKLE